MVVLKKESAASKLGSAHASPEGAVAPAGAAANGSPRRPGGRARQRRQGRVEDTDSPKYKLKVEGAQALGLWEKVQAEGWGGLSAAESGRVGGYMTRMLRLQRSAERQVGG